MSWGLLNAAMLAGLLGIALPPIIHLLNRRRDQVLDWGAMQFLELGRRARRKIRLTELLLMLARMALLALVALALARPFWSRSAATAGPSATRAGGLGGNPPPRDVVLILDGSASMDRKAGGTTARTLALQWARGFVGRLRAGDSVAVLIAGDHVRGLVNPPSFDRAKVIDLLARAPASRGGSDLPAALAEAFQVLGRTQNPGRDVIVLTDGQRAAWRPGEAGRWELLRDLRKRLPVPPRLWSVAFGAGVPPDGPNGSVGPLQVARGLVTPGLPVELTSTLSNAGPGPLTRTVELLVDGRPAPGTAQVVGPVPEGGRIPISFRTTLPDPGSHLLAIRLAGGDDALPADDEAATPLTVADALPVLLVDGEPGLEPLGGETDFLRAALAPTGDETPQVLARVVPLAAFVPASLEGRRVLVLANVGRLNADQAAAVGRFLEAGGGLLFAPGDRLDLDFAQSQPWLPARIGPTRGDLASKADARHPAPSSFSGPVMTPFAQGDAPPLAQADFFAHRPLEPAPDAAVIARLDNGDPWVVERPQGKAKVLLLSTPIDAEAGTLPVNPDFVPLVHEWIFHLAEGAGPQRLRPGEPLVFHLTPPPPEALKALVLETPDGSKRSLPIVRTPTTATARLDDTNEAGIYRLALADPPGGFAYASVVGDDRESDPAPLESAEAARLARGWPLAFEPDPARLTADLFTGERGGRHELWRGLILAALAGLCFEILLTRSAVRAVGSG